MTKTLNTLIKDMQDVLEHKVPAHLPLLEQTKMGVDVAAHLTNTLTPRSGIRTEHRLWFSQLGSKCAKKVWYEINSPDLAEPIGADTKFKFLYGNVLEELVLSVAMAAGHKVERQQERIEVPLGTIDGEEWSLTGRIDAVIDGHVIDVKSMSTYSFKEQPDDLAKADDLFGYRSQLGGYNDIIGEPGKAPALLCVDKQLGHMKLSYDYAAVPSPAALIAKAQAVARDASLAMPPPRRASEPMGKSGNMKLDTYCSYCAFKKVCWPGMRTFLYANKPAHLVVVKEEPKVPELHT